MDCLKGGQVTGYSLCDEKGRTRAKRFKLMGYLWGYREAAGVQATARHFPKG